MRKSYSANEDAYLKDNFKKMTYGQIANELGRTERSVALRADRIRSHGVIGYKNKEQTVTAVDIRLLTQGEINKLSMAQFILRIKNGSYINLMVGATKEKCLVEYVNENYFTVKRKNYRDSYKFVELMQGTVTILV